MQACPQSGRTYGENDHRSPIEIIVQSPCTISIRSPRRNAIAPTTQARHNSKDFPKFRSGTAKSHLSQKSFILLNPDHRSSQSSLAKK